MSTRRWKLIGPGSGRALSAILLVAALWWAADQGWWSHALRPFSGLSAWIQSHSLGQSSRSVLSDRDQLRQQVARLTTELTSAQAQLRLSRDLDQLAAYTSTTHQRVITAQVVTHQSDPGIDSLVIGQGSADGLRAGLAVIDADGLLIGKILTCREHSSTVLLVTDHQSVVIAQVDNDAHSQGVVRGERGLSLRLDYLPKTDKIGVGQAVVTSGTEAGVPPNIPIGSISSISTRSGDVFQSATVLSPIQPQEQTVVGVIVS